MKHFTGCCTDSAFLLTALDGVNVVFHCAGKMYTMDVFINVDHDLYWKDHVEGEVQLPLTSLSPQLLLIQRQKFYSKP